MKPSIFFSIDASLLCLILFVGCILMVIVGKKARDKFLKTDEQESKGGVNSLLGALFGLWGFILAFTFGNSSTRFDNVRAMMAEEASTIRNVYLRVETLPDSMRSTFREDLKKYLQARIDYNEFAEDQEKFDQAKEDAVEIGKNLWQQTVAASLVPGFGFAANNQLAALTAMYDIGARRDAILMSGIPSPISFMLFFYRARNQLCGWLYHPAYKNERMGCHYGLYLIGLPHYPHHAGHGTTHARPHQTRCGPGKNCATAGDV